MIVYFFAYTQDLPASMYENKLALVLSKQSLKTKSSVSSSKNIGIRNSSTRATVAFIYSNRADR
jgi:hypothetical protein